MKEREVCERNEEVKREETQWKERRGGGERKEALKRKIEALWRKK